MDYFCIGCIVLYIVTWDSNMLIAAALFGIGAEIAAAVKVLKK